MVSEAPKNEPSSFADAKKRVLITSVRRSPLIIPEDSRRFGFENDHKNGSPMCWRLAVTSTKDFVASGLRNATSVFTKSTEISIYFPAFTRYFVVKSFQNASGFTLSRILQCIDTTSTMAMAYYIRNDLDREGAITMADVRRLLKLYAICALNIKGNRIYCITADV